MTEGMHSGSGVGGFDSIDPRLTMFALANGMDLAKGEDYRRLEWFAEGLERGILIRADPDGTFGLTVMSWQTGHSGERKETAGSQALAADNVFPALNDGIETANALGLSS